MIIDKTLMIADGLAHNGSPTVIDLQSVGAGKGKPIRLFVQGSSTLAGCTGFVVTDDADGDADEALDSVTCDLAGKTVEYIVPQHANRYLKIDLIGTTSAGTWSCGVVTQPVQSNE
jgi:hypothetical protein